MKSSFKKCLLKILQYDTSDLVILSNFLVLNWISRKGRTRVTDFE